MVSPPSLLETAFEEAMRATSQRGLLLFDGTWSVYARVQTGKTTERTFHSGRKRYRAVLPVYQRVRHLSAGSLVSLVSQLRGEQELAAEVESGLTPLTRPELLPLVEPVPGSEPAEEDEAEGQPAERAPASGELVLTVVNELTGRRLSRPVAVEEMRIAPEQLPGRRTGPTYWTIDLGAWMRDQVRAVGADPDNLVMFQGKDPVEAALIVPGRPTHLGEDESDPRLRTGSGRLEVAREVVGRKLGLADMSFRPADDPDRRPAAEQARDIGLRLGPDGRPVERILGCRTVRSADAEAADVLAYAVAEGNAVGFRPSNVASGETGVEVVLCDRSGEAVKQLGEAHTMTTAVVQARRTLGIAPPPPAPVRAAPPARRRPSALPPSRRPGGDPAAGPTP